MTATPLTIPRSKVALNPIQWFSRKADPSDPDSADLWLIADPAFRADYPGILMDVKRAGWDTVMLGVLETQTLQDFGRMVDAAGLALAPGYAAIDVPPELPATGTAERVHLFDGIRRAAEESAYFGLDTIFLAPALTWHPWDVRTLEATAVGAGFDQARLERVTEALGEASDVLAAEGVRAGLHNHIGSWVETVAEIDYVLGAIAPERMGASFDIGHIAWLGEDAGEVIARHADRVIDLHVKDLNLEVAALSRATPTHYAWGPSRGLFTEPGDGDLDLVGILSRLPEGWDGWVIVEQDLTMLDPYDSAVRCAQWADATFRAA
ncbi:hypothetical protein GCM10009808_00880 [Microbacterium sediminicola]|uniref:Xylose isomerase-like TIM barrel domain-containing protein n=1 Tax=Microbacterium sediminicola TaxID=415210 RepID=A0ABP4TGV9_9MICO